MFMYHNEPLDLTTRRISARIPGNFQEDEISVLDGTGSEFTDLLYISSITQPAVF